MIEHKKIMLTQVKNVKSGRKTVKSFVNKTVHLVTGTSARDFSEFAANNHINLTHGTGYSAPHHENDDKWDFGLGYTGISNLCETGWISGTNSVCDFSEKIRENVKKNARYGRDTTGLFFDVSDVISGVPECYFKKSETKNTKDIQINVNITGSYKVPASLLHNRGAAILALIQSLQAENWRVKLSLFCCMLNYNIEGDDKNRGYCVQRVDLDTRPLDVSELSLILAHPGYMRRICFAVAETVEQTYSLGSYGGGTLELYSSYLTDFSCTDTERIISECKPITSDNTLNFMQFVLDTDLQFNTPETAALWVQSQLDNLK